MRSGLLDRLVHWAYVRRLYGRRCGEWEPDCVACREWRDCDECYGVA